MDLPKNFSDFLRKYASLPPSPKAIEQELSAFASSLGVELPVRRLTLRGGVLHILADSAVKHYLLAHKTEILSALQARIKAKIVDIR